MAQITLNSTGVASNGTLALQSNGTTTAVTIDASQKVGIGTASPQAALDVGDGSGGRAITWGGTNGAARYASIFGAYSSASLVLARGFTGSTSTDTYVSTFTGSNANTGIRLDVDGFINFFTDASSSQTAGNAFTPTPRMRIDSSGYVLTGKTAISNTDKGATIAPSGEIGITITTAGGGGQCLFLNSQDTDGTLVLLRQANTTEGEITVSGTTVTYGGGHLARFGQLPNGSEEPTLLKGTVLTNLDEMCVWINKETGVPADNEQCNKVKISDVDGDANVAGVFVSWSYDEQHDTNDLFVAMTGDMIIRIAQGTTVQRGDLLMSAGDGTAKPQGDDIVRSKTVAKVTSTHVTCTYADGSFCVPCVLMAC